MTKKYRKLWKDSEIILKSNPSNAVYNAIMHWFKKSSGEKHLKVLAENVVESRGKVMRKSWEANLVTCLIEAKRRNK